MKLALVLIVSLAAAQAPRGWTKGKGYGWSYGPNDELGALNAITSPAHTLAALRTVKTGKVYDLGVPIDQDSFKWPGHSPTQIMSFRSPAGVKRSMVSVTMDARPPRARNSRTRRSVGSPHRG